jgi:hemin uptake protein HemP
MTQELGQKGKAIADSAPEVPAPVVPSVMRIKSESLFQQTREIEIDHQGRIYRLRLTQMNKLILTA